MTNITPGQCLDCGTRIYPESRRCRPCANEAKRGRYPEIQRRWYAGESIREIANAVGSTENAMNVTIVRMRKAGYEMPYRHPMMFLDDPSAA